MLRMMSILLVLGTMVHALAQSALPLAGVSAYSLVQNSAPGELLLLLILDVKAWHPRAFKTWSCQVDSPFAGLQNPYDAVKEESILMLWNKILRCIYAKPTLLLYFYVNLLLTFTVQCGHLNKESLELGRKRCIWVKRVHQTVDGSRVARFLKKTIFSAGKRVQNSFPGCFIYCHLVTDLVEWHRIRSAAEAKQSHRLKRGHSHIIRSITESSLDNYVSKRIYPWQYAMTVTFFVPLIEHRLCITHFARQLQLSLFLRWPKSLGEHLDGKVHF